ncbi:PTS mannose/fructose/sorbose/N-acetylgalactosamine transporter subunit IIC [Collinsella tanakaei]|uniref:PTS mannose/fructose/sorbose/N-acetylgalactosamine transporter subunit IIC n=1 Tax=Collinsella tanakaei TaxID=626935 RepID=UPI0025A3E845|nr:PTS sugar transporter subunit IIC [Collinsella tanakaei]MDM8302650.1 PTS sugar transporter subunit IIC [Collinsella tanakaei]
MQLAFWQIAIVTIICGLYKVDRKGTQFFNHLCVFWAPLVGLALGDPMTGLSIGATVQLMSLGVAALGGSSVPDYPLAAMLGTALAITSGVEESVGLTIGIAVGMLGVELDVMSKIICGFIARRAERLLEDERYKSMLHTIVACAFVYFVECALPMFIVLMFGADVVNFILDAMPAWFTGGLSIAGGMLPVIGMAALLNYMPLKKFFAYAIIGFVLSAYLNLGILPIALVGAAAALEYYRTNVNAASASQMQGVLEDE